MNGKAEDNTTLQPEAMSLDDALAGLAPGADDQWLATRVSNELAARAQAKQWLKAHPRGLVGLARFFAVADFFRGLRWDDVRRAFTN